MKEIFIKYWMENRLLGLYSSKYLPNLTNHEISESNIKCEKIYKTTVELYFNKKSVIERTTYSSEGSE